MKNIEKWISRARTQAQRRRSPWNLLLAGIAVPLIGFVWFSSCRFILFLPRESSIPFREIANGHDIQMILVTIPLFFSAIAWGLIFANSAMWMIPSARIAFDTEAQGHRNGSFRESMSGILKFAIIVSVIAIPIAVIASYTIKL